MRYKLALGLSLILLSGTAVAHSADLHNNHNVEPEPGIIGAGSALYVLDVAYDSVVLNQSEIAFERASEMAVAGENGNTDAVERAKTELNNTVSEIASSNETKGLEKAEMILEQVRGKTDGRSNVGIGNAIENIQSNREKVEKNKGSGGSSSPAPSPSPGSGGGSASTDADNTDFALVSPESGYTFSGADSSVTYEVAVSGEIGEVKIFSDSCSASGVQIMSRSYDALSSKTFSVSKNYDCGGSFDWYAEYTGNDGSKITTDARSFSVETDASQTDVGLESPSDGSSFGISENTVNFDASVAGSSGSISIYADTCGSSDKEISSESYPGASSYISSGSYTYKCSGSFDWYAEYIGDDGSTEKTSTRSFTVG